MNQMADKNIKLIVGFGNPGEEYKETRHNIGFIFVDALAKKNGIKKWEMDKKIGAEIAEGKIELLKKKKIKAVLAKPQLFVNNSGQVVKKLKNFYKFKNENIIVTHDDLDIPFGKVKLSFDTSSAGHRGIESVIKTLKTKKFYRLRIGTSNNDLMKTRRSKNKKQRLKLILDFVISPFSKKEKSELKKVINNGVEKLRTLPK